MSNNSSMGNMSEPQTPATDYSDVPEAKSLLPPLPDTILKPSETQVKSTEQEDIFTSPRQNSSSASVFSTPPRRSTSRFQSINTPTPTTPRQIVTTLSGTGSQYNTPRSTMLSPSSEHHTPSTTQRNTNTSSPFSPVIPIDERFGVSLVEPDTMQEPASPMERLRHYEMCQRLQDAEFSKTCDSMKKSGWMSQKELAQLQKAKEENWRRWESKVKVARKEASLSRENSSSRFGFSKGINYHQGTESPTRRGEKMDGLGISSISSK